MTAADGRARLRLARCEPEGAAPLGVALRRAELGAQARRLAARAERYPALLLSLTPDMAVLWAPRPGDLPWFEAPLGWLVAAAPRLFTPAGWRIDGPAALVPAWMAALEQEAGLRPPLLLWPGEETAGEETAGEENPSEALRVIGLGGGAPLDAVDWKRLDRR